jgi:hypothetical protein
MLERLIGLFERLVVAQERQAAAAEHFAGGMTVADTAPAQEPDRVYTQELVISGNATAAAIDYEALAAQGEIGRAALLGMCNDRGIEVPPRTKTPTLVKGLQTWDLAHPNGVTATPAQEEAPPEQPDNDPFAVAAPNEVDPFADDTASTQEPAKVYTLEEVRGALQKKMQDTVAAGGDGTQAVVDALKKAANVARLKDLPEDKYPELMEAIGQ